MTKLEVVFLGTSSATPTRNRSLPAIAIRREGQVILMDCGEGAQGSFVRFGLGLNKEMLILITHLHGDHVNGLLGLLQTMSMSQRVRSLTLIAPPELFGWLKATMEVFHIGLTFDIGLVPVRSGVVHRGKDFRVRAARANHSVDAWSFVFEELPRPGVFDPNKARSLGVPEGKKWSSLQRGRSVVVAGARIRPGQVLGPERQGRSIGYSGDTRPTKRLARFFSGVELLIFDSTFAARDAKKAVERKHSTSTEAARLAREAGAKRLVLTHFSARYKRTDGLLRESRKIFPDTVAARDGLILDVPAVQ
ncbi:MAG: ribonuclease Z [Thaumarchaeota archaeon]|nr:ribonuclease Z [Nitrososphaerota archaeon]